MMPAFARAILPLAVFAFVAATGAGANSLQGGRPDLDALGVLVDAPSPLVDAARAAFDRVIVGITLNPEAKPQSTVTKDGDFVLWGDLFKTGRCFALVELRHWNSGADEGGVAFGEWKEGSWRLRQLWKIHAIWRSAGWKESDGDHLPITPATEPFALLDLSGNGIPEVILTGEVWRYWQEHFLLRFSPETRSLKLVANAMGVPARVDNYVRLYFSSGHRSIYEEWQFYERKGDKLVPVASWHDESPYNNVDPSFSEAVIKHADGSENVVRVSDTNLEPEFRFAPFPLPPDWENTYLVTTERQPFAVLKVNGRPWLTQLLTDDRWTIERAWLFEKITGLPRRLYPGNDGVRLIPRLEDFATVSVEGNAEAAKIFSIEP